jgi:LysM repeat protein
MVGWRWKGLFVLSLLFLAAVSSVAYADTSYKVKPGDYLFLLGIHFGVPWQNIASLNHLTYPYTIYPDQILRIPTSACSSEDSECYTVQPGDSLYLIGQRFDVPWQEIASLNHIGPPYLIYPGEKLAIHSD